jgi:hypothetical protein
LKDSNPSSVYQKSIQVKCATSSTVDRYSETFIFGIRVAQAPLLNLVMIFACCFIFFIIAARGVGWIPGTAWRKNAGMSWFLSPSLPLGAVFFIKLIDSFPVGECRDEGPYQLSPSPPSGAVCFLLN